MDRLRAMKMAAAAGNGDGQDRIEGSLRTTLPTATTLFLLSHKCSSLLRMQLSTEPPSSEGGNERRLKALKAA